MFLITIITVSELHTVDWECPFVSCVSASINLKQNCAGDIWNKNRIRCITQFAMTSIMLQFNWCIPGYHETICNLWIIKGLVMQYYSVHFMNVNYFLSKAMTGMEVWFTFISLNSSVSMEFSNSIIMRATNVPFQKPNYFKNPIMGIPQWK